MERKSASGSIRNKERSKKKFLDAVGKILKTKGYAGLKINDIAATAGVDKKMIYTYFGGMDGLMDEYLRTQDFWVKATSEEVEKMKPNLEDGGRQFIEHMLLSQFDYVYTNKEAQKLLLWTISEPRKSLKKLIDTQEENGEYIFKLLMESRFKENMEVYRSVMAIMVSGLYYLNMFASLNGSVFCGIDVNTPEGRANIKKAISFMVDQTYEGL
ncbi:TetR/AcrR family transcriptional regulator [Chryseobacterium sp. KBW03]|jgi:AcrR family transcriptional regulator|uniref:TetR/AcrR family transcriptional regulator n=1 Tax=unclassified Chryseobacterium TaxID=2593645 RepID=UPI000F5A2598|nr:MULTISPECIES: TetR/AcrR family transcriptional regulator [unclassified Chryseobacterium]RQO33798.1 TetR/AcrR family transcriptional regulator [Chryseobacterium sp. KBW03]UKB81513.1 TetR/AcrR family transcriptional regulator [Chryseobacterium sp. MEBOG07]